jgi:hypothetical protein
VVGLLICIFAVPALSEAQTFDTYTVSNVTVDVTAENINVARPRALAEGQRRAFDILVQRLTDPADLAKLPKPSDADLDNLVLDVGVDQEKSSAVRYLATLSVRFKPDAVRRLLQKAGLSFAEWRGRPVVVLPVYQADSGPVLAEATANPWRDAWRSSAAQGIIPFVVPTAEQIEGTVTTAQAEAGGDDVLNAVAQRLNTQDVVIAVAKPQQLEGGKAKVDISLTGSGPIAGSLRGTRSYTGEAGESLDSLLRKAVEDIARGANDTWKGGNLLQFDRSASLNVVVPLSGLADWLAVRERLARSTPVRSYEVASLSKVEADLVLHFVGEQSQLESVFMQNGLVLTWAEDHWSLKTVPRR